MPVLHSALSLLKSNNRYLSSFSLAYNDINGQKHSSLHCAILNANNIKPSKFFHNAARNIFFFHFLLFAVFFHYSYKFLFHFKYPQEVFVFYQGLIYIKTLSQTYDGPILAEVFPLNITIFCTIYYIDILFLFFPNKLHNELHKKRIYRPNSVKNYQTFFKVTHSFFLTTKGYCFWSFLC